MAYKTIMVCLNEVAALPALLAAGASLGRMFGAHVKGLYIIPGVTVYGGEGFAPSPVVYDGAKTFFEKNLGAVREKFETAMRAEGLTYDFQSITAVEPAIAGETVINARAADLVVMASMAAKGDQQVEDDFVETVAIASGRPVLALPPNGAGALSFEDIVIGWNNSREAARAVNDAMPLLKKAKRCRICSVDAPSDGTLAGAGLAEMLDRHGVKAETQSLASEGRNAGERLMLAANDFGSGLVVMGCYGHSRFSEMIFGGATRHVLRHADRPVLLSH